MPPKSSSKNEVTESAGVQSMEIALDIVRVIARAREGITLSEISRLTGFSLPKIHRYLASLVRSGFVDRGAEGSRYRLGEGAVALGLRALSRLNVRNVALDVLAKLNREIDKNVILFIWTKNGPVPIAWRESRDPFTFSFKIGVAVSPVWSSSGRLFLAFLPREIVSEVLKREFRKEGTVRWSGEEIGRREFEQRLSEIRRWGFILARSEMTVGVDAIGAPVFTGNGGIEYVIVAIGAAGGLDVSWEGSTVSAVRQAAKTLSVRLGYDANE